MVRTIMVIVLVVLPLAASGQELRDQAATADGFEDLAAQLRWLAAAAISLPLAAGLGAMLAFRPRRRGTPARKPAVVQTQIILALVGALVMLVVGQSLARAFGIVGAASLI